MGLTDKNLYAYCDNNPITRSDNGGNLWFVTAIKAAVGAVVNVTTSYISAKVTGQKFTWADAGIAALSGALGAIPKVGALVSSLLSGGYSIFSNYKNGASLPKSIFLGVLAFGSTFCSIGNLSKLGDSASEIVTEAATELVFGTGYGLVTSAVNRAIE